MPASDQESLWFLTVVQHNEERFLRSGTAFGAAAVRKKTLFIITC
jgi:hypothetical protein